MNKATNSRGKARRILGAAAGWRVRPPTPRLPPPCRRLPPFSSKTSCGGARSPSPNRPPKETVIPNGVTVQTVDKAMRQKMDTHGESARGRFPRRGKCPRSGQKGGGDWLFPLAFDILKNENFFGSSHSCCSRCRHFVDTLNGHPEWGDRFVFPQGRAGERSCGPVMQKNAADIGQQRAKPAVYS